MAKPFLFATILNRAQVIAAVHGTRLEIERHFRDELVRVGRDIMLISKSQYVPIRTGELMSSGRVEFRNLSNKDVLVELKYGGPPDYAVIVHEVDKNYRNGRQWKYLETPAKQYPTEATMTANMRRSLAGRIGGLSSAARGGSFL